MALGALLLPLEGSFNFLAMFSAMLSFSSAVLAALGDDDARTLDPLPGAEEGTGEVEALATVRGEAERASGLLVAMTTALPPTSLSPLLSCAVRALAGAAGTPRAHGTLSSPLLATPKVAVLSDAMAAYAEVDGANCPKVREDVFRLGTLRKAQPSTADNLSSRLIPLDGPKAVGWLADLREPKCKTQSTLSLKGGEGNCYRSS